MNKNIYFGVFDYDGQPGVLLVNAEDWDGDGHFNCSDVLTKEVCKIMCEISKETSIEYVEESLYAWAECTEEELHRKMIEKGFIYNEEVKKEGESILEMF